MTFIWTALIIWYGLQFIEAWVYAAAGGYTSGRPVQSFLTTVMSVIFAMYVWNLGLDSWPAWILFAMYVLNTGGGLMYLVRGPKWETWGVAPAVFATVIGGFILYMWSLVLA